MSVTSSPTSDSTTAAPSSGELLRYATGSLGMGVWVTVPGLLLAFYLTNVLGVSPFLAGFALLLPKVLDVIVHPWFGTLSDRQRARRGNRRHMMWIGLFLALALVGMFSVPASLSGGAAALWVAFFFMLGNLLFASFQVPYLTTPSDLNVGYHQRTRVMTFRMVVLTVGLLGAGVLAPALVKSGERGDYTMMAILLSSVMVVSGIVAILGIKRLQSYMPTEIDTTYHPSFREGVKIALSDRNFRMLVLSYLFTGTVTHLFMAGVPYYAEYVFGNVGLTALFMGSFLAPAILASPMWLRVSKRVGKQRGLLISQLMFIVGSLALAAGAVLGLAVTTLVVVLLGVAFAGLQLFAFSMVPDVVRAASADGSKAASYTGVWTATEATGTAIGPYIYMLVLGLGGFVASTAANPVVQSQSAQNALVLGFTVVPAVLMAVAMLFQRRYSLEQGAFGSSHEQVFEGSAMSDEGMGIEAAGVAATELEAELERVR
ncbi:MAG: MFS transporter [Candidatus Nanopelagicales bacterium]